MKKRLQSSSLGQQDLSNITEMSKNRIKKVNFQRRGARFLYQRKKFGSKWVKMYQNRVISCFVSPFHAKEALNLRYGL